MVYAEYYRCNQCGDVWCHEWDTDDYSNDFTQCPRCEDFDYDDITYGEYITEYESK